MPETHDKGKPAARRGRKATGLQYGEAAGPPKGVLGWDKYSFRVEVSDAAPSCREAKERDGPSREHHQERNT